MEKHRCKLCLKSFVNGRALGGHMKSHIVASLPTRRRLRESHHESSASSSSSSFGDPDGKSPSYKLRENPRKSFRVADPAVSFANLDSRLSSVVNAEENEPEPGNPVQKRVRKLGVETRRRRSKKTEKKTTIKTGRNAEEPKRKKKKEEDVEKGQNSNDSTTESPEPASSVSDPSPEEDLAMCLIMLSRDARKLDAKLKKLAFDKPEETEEGKKPGKRRSSKLRRCLLDLNMPPPAEDDEACSVVSAMLSEEQLL
ncbi:PREDICTED: zinc finger protein ZAT4-like [Tarenaya hassleriana]|uniref:zinc finger protein ZAT4-like n=1 Tax=Tarenaya hassleriana TaxID=28532 RepID=UPI00053C51A9|nr:PREDICTED: zinc finger protein ZAT4-like [Tarenaya hassleriana]